MTVAHLQTAAQIFVGGFSEHGRRRIVLAGWFGFCSASLDSRIRARVLRFGFLRFSQLLCYRLFRATFSGRSFFNSSACFARRNYTLHFVGFLFICCTGA